MDSDDDTPVGIFSNRANKIMKSKLEAYEKLDSEKYEEEPPEDEYTSLLGKIKEKLKKRKPAAKKGRKTKKKPEKEVEEPLSPSEMDQDSANEDVHEPITPPPATKRSTRRTKKSVDVDVEDDDLRVTPLKLPMKAKRRLKELKLKTAREAAQVDEEVKRALLSCDQDVLEASKITSQIELERTMTLKIRYMSEITKISVLQNEKFNKIFNKVADLYQLKATEILLCFEDQNIQLEDTPLSLNLKFYDVIDCIPFKPPEEVVAEKDDPNKLLIKFQSSDSRKRVEMHIHKLEKSKVFMEKYAALRELPLGDLFFEFDSETINGSETPEDLDLESGCCIDVKVTKVAPQEADLSIIEEYIAPVRRSQMLDICVLD